MVVFAAAMLVLAVSGISYGQMADLTRPQETDDDYDRDSK